MGSRGFFAWLMIAVGALSAITAQSAVALPEVGRCVAQAGTGRYKDPNCTQKAGSLTSEKAFEFKKGAVKKGFSGAGGEAVIESASGTRFRCKGVSTAGEYREALGSIKGAQTVLIRLTGCELPIGGSCRSRGAALGEFVTSSLKGKLGYASGEKTASPSVGLELRPESSKGPFLEIECQGGSIVIKVGVSPKTPNGNDCVIGLLAPPNLMSSTFNDVFSGSEGTQSPQAFENTPTRICNLEVSANGGAYERTDLAFSSTLGSEEEVEIKA